MPNFTEFSRETPRGGGDEAMFTLQARGLLSLNQAAFDALGEPEAVVLLYDADEQIVALRKVDADHPNAHSVRKQQRAKSYLVSAQAFTAHHRIPTPRARRFAGVDYGRGTLGFPLLKGIEVENRRGALEAERAVIDRWRHASDDPELSAVRRIDQKSFSSPGHMRVGLDRSPSVRVGTLVACAPLGPTPTATQLRARFLAFLTWQPILDLVSRLSHINSGAVWRSLAGNGRLLLEAALMTEDQVEVPVASAMLVLPDSGRSAFGSDPRCAEFVLHIEPRGGDGSPAPTAGLPEWRDRFARALEVPSSLAQFLSHDLALAAFSDPAAQFGLWLKAPRSITELVDVGNLTPLPGSPQANWFATYAIADQAGAEAGSAADAMLAQLCEHTLHLDGWESEVKAR